jgi:iron-sulfur cluster repair protein YtfE (RIC family)
MPTNRLTSWASGARPDIEDGTMTEMTKTSTWSFAEHEHLDLVRGIQRIHDIACEVGGLPRTELSVDLIEVGHWIDGTLEPHIAWEETWLYPEIDARTDGPWATRAASFDHRQIRGIAAEIRADQVALRSQALSDHAEIRCHLFSFVALVRAHIEREERFLIPILAEEMGPAERHATPIETVSSH